jgi:hypothetical protein
MRLRHVHPTALCGQRSSPVSRRVRAMVAEVSSSETRPEANHSRRLSMAPCPTAKPPSDLRLAMSAATHEHRAHRRRTARRSKLELTWMSMDGLMEGTTPSLRCSPVTLVR